MRATLSIPLPRFGFEGLPLNAKLDRHTFLRCEARLTGMSHVEPAFLNVVSKFRTPRYAKVPA